MHLTFFPQVFIELNKEVVNHPVLSEWLQNHPQSEFEILFAEICHYCNVAIDGTFDEEGLEKIAEILLDRLKRSRMSIIWTPPAVKGSDIIGAHTKRPKLIIADDYIKDGESARNIFENGAATVHYSGSETTVIEDKESVTKPESTDD